MARWRQVKDPETGKYHMIPLDDAAIQRDKDRGIIVRNVEAFKSPIDGSIISTYREYMDHCKKHNVVPAAEFSQEWYESKAKERERFYKGEMTRQEKFKRKQELWEIWNRAERGLL